MKSYYYRILVLPVVTLVISALLLGSLGACSRGKKKESSFVPAQDWLQDMRTRVGNAGLDDAKKTELSALIDGIERKVHEFDSNTKNLYADLERVDRNYDATADDFRAVFAAYNAERKMIRDGIIDIRFKMSALVTQEEWQHLSRTTAKTKEGLFKQLIRRPGG